MPRKRKLEVEEVPGSKRGLVQNPGQTVRSSSEAGFTETLVPHDHTQNLSKVLIPTIDNIDSTEQGYSTDRKSLLDIFPEEIWLLVFKELEHIPSQLEKVSNASLFFRELLLSKRHNFMFPSVWCILESKYKKKDEQKPKKIVIHLHETLKLRCVCRSWCKEIDNAYQTHSIHYEMDPEMISFSDEILFDRLTLGLSRWEFFGGRIFRKFVPHFSQTHQITDRNPFVARSLHLCLEADDTEEFKGEVQSILEKYGQHVWHCNISFIGTPQPIPTDTNIYCRLREVLCRMMNLKTLHVTSIWYQEAAEPEDLHNAIVSNPLPSLDQLRMIKSVGLADPVLKEMVSCNNSITALDIQQTKFSKDDLSSLKNLQTFAVTFTSHEHLLVLLPMESPLTKLYLRCEVGSTLNLEKLYEALEAKYKHTLTFLHVNLISRAKIDDFREPHTHMADLPCLTHLELKLEGFILMDGLLPLSGTLTNLNISLNSREKYSKALEDWYSIEEHSRIKFFSCSGQSYFLESNIWSLFSKLNHIQFKYDGPGASINCSTSRHEWAEVKRTARNVLKS